MIVLINCLFVRQDPAVTQHSSTGGYATLDLYNPFENSTAVSNKFLFTCEKENISLTSATEGKLLLTLFCYTQDT